MLGRGSSSGSSSDGKERAKEGRLEQVKGRKSLATLATQADKRVLNNIKVKETRKKKREEEQTRRRRISGDKVEEAENVAPVEGKKNDRREKLEEFVKQKRLLEEAKRKGAKPVFRPGGGKVQGQQGGLGNTSPFGNSTLSTTRMCSGTMRRGASSTNLTRGLSTTNLARGTSSTNLARGTSTTNLARGLSTTNLAKSNLSRVASRSDLATLGTKKARGGKEDTKAAAREEIKKPEESKPEEETGVRRSSRARKAPQVLAGPGGSTRANQGKAKVPLIEVQPARSSPSSQSSTSSTSSQRASFAPENTQFVFTLAPTGQAASTPKDGRAFPRPAALSAVSEVAGAEAAMEDEVFK